MRPRAMRWGCRFWVPPEVVRDQVQPGTHFVAAIGGSRDRRDVSSRLMATVGAQQLWCTLLPGSETAWLSGKAPSSVRGTS